jgi:fumarate reductase subunit D
MSAAVVVEAILVPVVVVLLTRALLRLMFPLVTLPQRSTRWRELPVESRLLIALYVVVFSALALLYAVLREIVVGRGVR